MHELTSHSDGLIGPNHTTVRFHTVLTRSSRLNFKRNWLISRVI